MVSKAVAVFVTSMAALLAGSTAVVAHTQLVKATPAANSEVRSPSEIALQSSERLEGAFSWVRVRDSSGQQVDKKDTHNEKNDNKIIRFLSTSSETRFISGPMPSNRYRSA